MSPRIEHKRFLPFLLLILLPFYQTAQIPVYTDYIGGGHSEGIGVRSSSNLFRTDFQLKSTHDRSIDGNGLDARRMAASRFLCQAAYGGTPLEIHELGEDLNFEAWMDNQFNQPLTSMRNEAAVMFQRMKIEHGAAGNDVDNYKSNQNHFQYAWWHAVITRPDVLRQRVSQALSEILVISANSDIRNKAEIYGSYYDIFMSNAFGNYRDILDQVTYHPAMGKYLSHFRNPKADTVKNTYPDENYAREVMQLFTIGLYELNNDGSYKLDSNGETIPTYSIDDIKETAKIFTGFGAGALTQSALTSGKTLSFRTGDGDMNYEVPMTIYQNKHEEEEKYLINGLIIPAGNNGKNDVKIALDHLFNHPNVGPFIGRKLIQHFVKSNPSALYIDHVASAFNDNGNGVRGDMKAVLKAILLHPEARECLWMEEPGNGKLRAPVQRYAQFARGMAKIAPDQLYATNAYSLENNTAQRPMDSPSVFNFYSPFYQPSGPLADHGLYAPEFEIYNSVTSIGYLNEVDTWTRRGRLFGVYELEKEVKLDKAAYYPLATDMDILLNYLDVQLTHGRMSEETRNIIKTSIEGLGTNNPETNLRQRVELATYLVMISPEYVILK